MKISTKNDYGKLKDCILCYPSNIGPMEDGDPVVDRNKASEQYNKLVRKLVENGTLIDFMTQNGGLSQVFARDVGFVIDDILFVSSMTHPKRKNEIEQVKGLAFRNNVKVHLMQNSAEGGDVVLDNKRVFIGQGQRTNGAAFEEIRQVLKEHGKKHELVKVFYQETLIHLDCAFEILNNDACVMSTGVFNEDEVRGYFKDVVQVPDEDMKDLAANIVQLGKNKYLCSSENFTKILNERGYNTEFLDFSEIIKANGGLGCCVLPLLRG